MHACPSRLCLGARDERRKLRLVEDLALDEPPRLGALVVSGECADTLTFVKRTIVGTDCTLKSTRAPLFLSRHLRVSWACAWYQLTEAASRPSRLRPLFVSFPQAGQLRLRPRLQQTTACQTTHSACRPRRTSPSRRPRRRGSPAVSWKTQQRSSRDTTSGRSRRCCRTRGKCSRAPRRCSARSPRGGCLGSSVLRLNAEPLSVLSATGFPPGRDNGARTLLREGACCSTWTLVGCLSGRSMHGDGVGRLDRAV